MHKYEVGDLVSCSEYDIKIGVVIRTNYDNTCDLMDYDEVLVYIFISDHDFGEVFCIGLNEIDSPNNEFDDRTLNMFKYIYENYMYDYRDKYNVSIESDYTENYNFVPFYYMYDNKITDINTLISELKDCNFYLYRK